MKIFTCYVPKKLLGSPVVKKIEKCVEIKVIKAKDCYKPKFDFCKPYGNGDAAA